MKDRLLKLIIHLGLTATRFADEIGVQRSGISHILSGRNQPSYDFIVKITSRYPEISLDWLILGKGSMLRAVFPASAPVQKELFAAKPAENRLKDKAENPPPENTIPVTDEIVTNVTFLERVVFFYADGTFTPYLPRK